MRLAIFRKVAGSTTDLEGDIDIPFGGSGKVFLRPNPRLATSKAAKPPVALAYYRNEEIGAFFKETSPGGVEYLSGALESPMFPGGKIHVSIFRAREDDRAAAGERDMLWSPPRNAAKSPAAESSGDPY